MDPRGSELSDMGVVLLADAIVRRMAMDLWSVSGKAERKPHRHVVWIPGPDGRCVKQKESDEEYSIRCAEADAKREKERRELEHWFRTPYAGLLLGCCEDCLVRDTGNVDAVIMTIKRKRRDGVKLFNMDEGQRRMYYRRQSKRLKG